MPRKSNDPPLERHYNDINQYYEIGIDEAGRGPLFGRLYCAAVVLPQDDSFDHSQMKDSKKFTSKEKIKKVSDYIKEHALAWNVQYADEKTIDSINIRQAVLSTMRVCAKNVTDQIKEKYGNESNIFLLVDGNDFSPMYYQYNDNAMETLQYTTVEGADRLYTHVAAASILAKVDRDEYILELCDQHPELCEKYSIHTNKGYGAAKHIAGIKEHGITKWHRKSYGICKQY